MDHDPESHDPDPKLYDLSAAISTARRGFRRDTELLVAHLDDGAVFVPLALPVEDVPLGERLRPDELTLRPHLLPTDTNEALIALFTDETLLSEFASELGWKTTDEGDLQYCTLPARAGLDLAADLIRRKHCEALVINPSHDDELFLHLDEVDALRQGQTIPLVGYVRDLPVGEGEETLISELEGGQDPTLVAALDECVAHFSDLSGYRLEQTFNRERDVEPHPTLTLVVKNENLMRDESLRTKLFETLEGKLPAPGYVDVLFEIAE